MMKNLLFKGFFVLMVSISSAGVFDSFHVLQYFARVAGDRSNFSGRKDRCRTFRSNCRDRMECGRI